MVYRSLSEEAELFPNKVDATGKEIRQFGKGVT